MCGSARRRSAPGALEGLQDSWIVHASSDQACAGQQGGALGGLQAVGEHEVAHGERGRHVPAAGVQVDKHVKHPQLWLAARGVVAVQQLQSPPEVAPLDCPLQHCQQSTPSL